MKQMETDRLVLRAWTLNDLDELYAYAVSPNVGPNAGWKPHQSKEESLEILLSFMDSQQDWAIMHKGHSRVIGSIGLRADPKRNMENALLMGYVLAEDFWGQGLATEAARRIICHAFDDLNAQVLGIAHYPFNARSKRVIEKCGFVYEGTIRKAVKIYNGDVLDLMCYSILKSEYYSEYYSE